MVRRSEDWEVGLSHDLRDPAFAREFLLASIDEGIPIQIALGNVIRVCRESADGQPERASRNLTEAQSNPANTEPAPEAVSHTPQSRAN